MYAYKKYMYFTICLLFVVKTFDWPTITVKYQYKDLSKVSLSITHATRLDTPRVTHDQWHIIIIFSHAKTFIVSYLKTFNPLIARIFIVFGQFIRGQSATHKEAWVAKLPGTLFSIQVHKKLKHPSFIGTVKKSH